MAEYYFDSNGAGKIRVRTWTPEGTVKAVVQLVHGIAEHADRYDAYACWLNTQGIAVVAADHMGHGKSIGSDGIQGYFHGGWFAAVADTYALLQRTMAEYPGVPYILFGHSMGSFIARTVLEKYPDSGIAGCILSGTAWQGAGLLAAAKPMCKLLSRGDAAREPSPTLQKVMFGSYNSKVEHPVSFNDWLSRDASVVAAYDADPLCGFTATAGLYRDMILGIDYIQRPENLRRMNPKTPVYFIAGGDDPVGAYGKGVRLAAEKFKALGMEQVSLKLYPLCRHEILNEINRMEVYEDTLKWIENVIKE